MQDTMLRLWVMSNWYKVVYKQIQPLHIGAGSYGIINETRIFIPGLTMWGALTNAYGISKKWKDEDYKDDENKQLFENITCFYPSFDKKNFLKPSYKNGEFYLGEKSEIEFRKEFVDTYLSTAINPATLNAQDESLHEIDVILPKDIYWIGYLNIDDENKIPEEIYVGGEIRYGLGKMKLESKQKEDSYKYQVKKGIYENENSIHKPLQNYIKFENQTFEGELELVVTEFDFSKNRPEVKEAEYYIKPGGKIIVNEN
jgi:hypothetical protein